MAQRFIIASPTAILNLLEEAHAGRDPQELMFEVLDEAEENIVRLTKEDDEEDA